MRSKKEKEWVKPTIEETYIIITIQELGD